MSSCMCSGVSPVAHPARTRLSGDDFLEPLLPAVAVHRHVAVLAALGRKAQRAIAVLGAVDVQRVAVHDSRVALVLQRSLEVVEPVGVVGAKVAVVVVRRSPRHLDATVEAGDAERRELGEDREVLMGVVVDEVVDVADAASHDRIDRLTEATDLHHVAIVVADLAHVPAVTERVIGQGPLPDHGLDDAAHQVHVGLLAGHTSIMISDHTDQFGVVEVIGGIEPVLRLGEEVVVEVRVFCGQIVAGHDLEDDLGFHRAVHLRDNGRGTHPLARLGHHDGGTHDAEPDHNRLAHDVLLAVSGIVLS